MSPLPEAVRELLDRLPARPGAGSDPRSAVWLEDAARLLDRDLDDVARARVLDARSLVRATVVAPRPQSVAAQLHLDAARAAELYEDAGMAVEAAASYATAATGAAYCGNLDVALDIAVRAIAAFSAVSAAEHDPAARARLAVRLAGLCSHFFDDAAAREFYGIAADDARTAQRGDLWTTATLGAADVLERRLSGDDRLDAADRTGLAEDLERLALSLARDGDDPAVRGVDARRLLARAALARGDVAVAAEQVEQAWAAAGRTWSGPSPALLRTRAQVLAARGRTREALVLLDEALVLGDPSWDLPGHVLVLDLRSRVRRAEGDLAGAVADVRRLAADVLGRHQQRLGGFLGQVLARARVEGERRALLERAETLALTVERDPLTQVGNRRSVERLLERLEPELPLAVALVDLDEFKGVNDTFGHELGDRLLVELAGLLVGTVAGAGHVARWGGEEFVVVLPGATRDDAEALGEQVRRTVEDRRWSAGAVGLRLTVSVGLAFGRAGRAAGLLSLADEAMYSAKESGRNRLVSVRPTPAQRDRSA